METTPIHNSVIKVWYCHNILRILHKIVKHGLHVWSGDWRHHGRSSVERITQLHRSGTQFYHYRSSSCFWPPRVVNIKCLSPWIRCLFSLNSMLEKRCIWGILLVHLSESQADSKDKRYWSYSLSGNQIAWRYSGPLFWHKFQYYQWLLLWHNCLIAIAYSFS